MDTIAVIRRNLLKWRVLCCVLLTLGLVLVSLFAVILFSPVEGYFTGINVFSEDMQEYYSGLFVVATVFAGAFLIFWLPMRSYCSNKRQIPPYEVPLDNAQLAEILDSLKDHVRLHHVAENCWYGREIRRKELRVFVFSCFEDQKEYTGTAEEVIEKVNRKTHFPPRMDYKEMRLKMGRIQLFVFDKIPHGMLDSASKDTVGNLHQSEFLINLFVDSEKGILCVPVCRPCIAGTAHLYSYGLKRLAEWLL